MPNLKSKTMFNLPALQELAKEFKLMRQDLQAMRASVERIEKYLATNPATLKIN